MTQGRCTHFPSGDSIPLPFRLRDSAGEALELMGSLELTESALVGHDEAAMPRLCEQGWQVQFAKCIKARR